MTYKISPSFVMAGRLNGESPIDFEQSRFGFYWFYLLPSISHNGGAFKKQECVDVGFYWLCFTIEFTFWPNSKDK